MKKNELVAILKDHGFVVEEKKNAYDEDMISIKSDDASIIGAVLQGDKLNDFLESHEDEESVLRFVSVMFDTDQYQNIKDFVSDLKDPEYVKGNVIPCIRKKGLKDDAMTIPVRDHLKSYDDLEVYFRIRNKGNDASTIIKKGMLKALGIEIDNLVDLAESNMKDKYSIKTMLDQLKEMGMFPEEMLADMEDAPILVITSSDMLYGAYAINIPEILDKACHKLNSDMIMIIPSSIHEIICVPYEMDMKENEVAGIISSVNDKNVPVRDRLSDHPYIYRLSDYLEFPTEVPEIPDPVEYEDLPF